MAHVRSVSRDGRTTLDLNWDPSGSPLDVRVVIRDCNRSQVQERLVNSTQPIVCNLSHPGDNCTTEYEFIAPAGTEIFTRSYMLACRDHAVDVKVKDNNASQATATALL